MSQRGSKTGNFSSRVAQIPSFTMIIDKLNEKWKYLESLIEKNEKYIESLNDQINRLETRLKTSNSIQKKDEIEGWLKEKYKKIEAVESKNNSISASIQEIKKKIIYYKRL